MAHGLYENDWMLSTKQRPWHGIGTIVEEAPTSEDALRIAKLDWKVTQAPIMANGKEIPGYYANIRTDINQALGIVKGRYQILQNNEAFAFVDDIVNNVSGVECQYETAGSLFNGKRCFMLVNLPDMNILGDKVENYLFFTNSHDGSSPVMAGTTNVRVVCNNTLQCAIRGAKRTWKCRHTTAMSERQAEAIESLGFAIRYNEKLAEHAETMAATKVSEKYFFDSFEKEAAKVWSEKGAHEIAIRVDTIYRKKDDLRQFKKTAWGLYNAVADYCSNTLPLKSTSTWNERKLAKTFDGFPALQIAENILMAA